MQNNKFDFWCFKPSNKALYNVVLYAFAFYGMYEFGLISQVMHVWHLVGHQLLGFLVFYYMTYELFDFWESMKINKFSRVIGSTMLEKFLFIDKKINADLFDEVDEQISCLSKNLQVLLMKLKVPEAKARKITVKKAGIFLMKIPVYIVVFLIIVLWDFFYKNFIPAVWKITSYIWKKFIKYSGLALLGKLISKTRTYRLFRVWTWKNKMWARILVAGFVFIFVLMEALKISAIGQLTQGHVLLAVSLYLGGAALFLIVHPYLEKNKRLMMTINWFKIRYHGVVKFMEIFEETNSYKKVMAQLAKAKAVLRTVWKQLKAIFSIVSQIISVYKRNLVNSLRQTFGLEPLAETESVSIIDEIKREHDSLWKGIRPYIKSVFDKIKALEEEENVAKDKKGL